MINTQLVAPDIAVGDAYGWSVGLSDAIAVVGAPEHDDAGAEAGAAYVFHRAGHQWNFVTKLMADDIAPADRFGASVAVGTDTIVAGAPNHNETGAVYLFSRNNDSWVQQTNLVAFGLVTVTGFGRAVAMDGDTLVIVANTGVNVFVRDGATWIPQAALIPATISGPVDIHQNTIIIGGDETAYVYQRAGSEWTLETTLTASDGQLRDGFGYAVAVYGDGAVVGAQYAGVNPRFHPGAAYLYHRQGTNWMEQATIRDAERHLGGQFGFSVTMVADAIVIGAISPLSGDGTIYYLASNGSNAVQKARVEMPAGTYRDHFGFSTAAQGARFITGAVYHNMGCDWTQDACQTGAAFLYEKVPLHDLAIVRLKAPKRITLKSNQDPAVGRVRVLVQNRGPFAETITNLDQLADLVQVRADSTVTNCTSAVPVVLAPHPENRVPVTVQPGGKLTVHFDVEFTCANDPAKGAGHEDFRFSARLQRLLLDGEIDTHPECDLCPRSPVSPETDPNPDGMGRDTGCGTITADHSTGGAILTDIVVK